MHAYIHYDYINAFPCFDCIDLAILCLKDECTISKFTAKIALQARGTSLYDHESREVSVEVNVVLLYRTCYYIKDKCSTKQIHCQIAMQARGTSA